MIQTGRKKCFLRFYDARIGDDGPETFHTGGGDLIGHRPAVCVDSSALVISEVDGQLNVLSRRAVGNGEFIFRIGLAVERDRNYRSYVIAVRIEYGSISEFGRTCEFNVRGILDVDARYRDRLAYVDRIGAETSTKSASGIVTASSSIILSAKFFRRTE